MSHTPGPWKWVTDNFRGGYAGLVGRVGQNQQEVLFPNHANDGDEGAAWFEDFPSEADRNLIAAAPDLLEACERLLWLIKTHLKVDGGHIARDAESAVLKAKGELNHE